MGKIFIFLRRKSVSEWFMIYMLKIFCNKLSFKVNLKLKINNKYFTGNGKRQEQPSLGVGDLSWSQSLMWKCMPMLMTGTYMVPSFSFL